MVHINKIKTLNGFRYAVVNTLTRTIQDEKGRSVNITEELPVDYQTGNQTNPAIFSFTNEGLAQAKDVQKVFQ